MKRGPLSFSFDARDERAVRGVVDLHGHLVDAGAFDRYSEVFTDDVVYDVRDLGGPVIHGITEAQEVSAALGDRNPVAHLVTNVVVERTADDEARAWSKGLGLTSDGALGSVVYLDRIVRTPTGWRIAERTVLARRTPLARYPLPG